jgi:60 kDa SS-A/Ro ribonucleoprotein
MQYSQLYTRTPQRERAPGRPEQVRNQAGGYGWKASDEQQLRRFLILGTTHNTYYSNPRDLFTRNVDAIERLIARDGLAVVEMAKRVSLEGLAPSNDPAIFVLALASARGDKATRQAAHQALPEVCRIPTHWFHLAQYVTDLRGWGRGIRRVFQQIYQRPVDELAFHVAKYPSRNGWSHRDVLRMAHVVPPTQDHALLYKLAAHGFDCANERYPHTARQMAKRLYGSFDDAPLWLKRLMAIEEIKHCEPTVSDAYLAMHWIKEYGLTRAMLPGGFLQYGAIWEALLDHIGLGELLRNLANMARVGALAPVHCDLTDRVSGILRNEGKLRSARIHPIEVLKALLVYRSGRSPRSKGQEWSPAALVLSALEEAFYTSFQNVAPTGKRILLAVDHSGSMTEGLLKMPYISARQASAAMAMVTARREKNTRAITFGTSIRPLDLHPDMSLQEVVRAVSGDPEGTNCALPIHWAMQRGLTVDAFVLYTDNQTWAGDDHVFQAMREYRRRFNPQARVVAVAMTAARATIVDPKDALGMNVVGFDSAAPSLISSFIRGEL